MDGHDVAATPTVRNAPRINARRWIFGLAMILAATFGSHAAFARTAHHSHHHLSLASRHGHGKTRLAGRGRERHARYAGRRVHNGHVRYASTHYRYHNGHIRYASAHYRHSGIQCVPYAREVSHIELSGDAFLWWAEANGRYARGDTPAEGAVLNFRAVGRMPLGHVAVVTDVIDSRTVLVTQANWVRGTITNDVTMQDVSPNNDWTDVEVELGDGNKWGAPYPTYGFIYNQPDDGTTIAAATPDDAQSTEVAEAPRPTPITTDAPDRNLQ